MKSIFPTLALSLLLALPSHATPLDTALSPAPHLEQVQTSDIWTKLLNAKTGATVFAASCCKVCRKGKACGNSCISRSYSCHKGPGCACDAR